MSLDRVSKIAPNGKQILDRVGLGMYLGAKIGVLGQNGSGKSSVMRILAGKTGRCSHNGIRRINLRSVTS